ncbi:3'-to-5' oligoribonuclease B, Bacillus type [hydrothermal vent metagenome]|uniref:3'-to-5' oligoribonuclease B, Bacillus type n=1 Tax=hydrothermal vent metagenome TaxID=652676 RepID=A0A1W1EKY3_9ZZZZ
MNQIFHLSHIDLDGYGCQFLTKKHFDNITCYNANYGPEVSAMLEEIIRDIFTTGAKNPMILITDLNLTPKESRWIETQANKVGASLQLLDHHATGESSANKYGWYFLDTSKSATKITYNWLTKKYNFDKDREFSELVEVINAIDIWIDDSEYFELGKVCLGMISGARELNKTMFPTEDREYKLFLISKILSVIKEDNSNILLDDKLHSIRKEFFMQDKNDTKDNLVASFVVDLVSEQKDRFTIYYEGYKGVLLYGVGNSSIIGNKFLIDNSDYNFYMDIAFRGNFSLRGNGTMDVSKMAQAIGNGGGHPNASGGKIDKFKSSFIYEDVKSFVEEHIKEL